MVAYPLRTAALTLAAAVGLSACTTGLGYGPYGGSGVSVGINSGYYDPYYDGYGYGYSRARYGYTPYWGWYDGFYYPGTGYYVYDIYRRPHRWNDRQRRYWTDRLRSYRHSHRHHTRDMTANWQDFRTDRRAPERATRIERRDDRRAPQRVNRTERREERRVVRQGTASREQLRASRQEERRASRKERSEERKARREGRRDRRD